ncbi:MAG: alpha-amylase [Bacteroidaceae bacterium]|nr:alpha-amylase [Bacteroidaceae bacterium]
MKPVIYQLLPRLYYTPSHPTSVGGTLAQNGCGKLRDFTARCLQAIRELGATHIWYTGILDHATRTDFTAYGLPADIDVKGEAGSPYAVRDYYNVAPELATDIPGRLREFELLVGRTHRAGMGVMIDFVPNHVARHYTGTFHPFTDRNYYPGHICDGDWTDTAKLNYGDRDTWQKMLDILLFWAARGIDGFRCDMAELVPVAFWQWAIPQVKAVHPNMLFVAEVYQPWRYAEYVHQGGFDYLYDKVGLYDTLVQILKGHEPASAITRTWQSLGDLGPHMLHFMENHDEQRLASDFICGDGRRALPAMIVSALIDTCPVMVYFGQELGERGMEAEGFSGCDGKTTIFDYAPVPTISRWLREAHQSDPLLRNLYSSLLRFAATEPAITEGRFFDLMYVNPASDHFDPHRQYAFLRTTADERILVCVNFDEAPRDIRLRIPRHAFDYLGIPCTAVPHFPFSQPSPAGDAPFTIAQLQTPVLPDGDVPIHLPAWGGVALKF